MAVFARIQQIALTVVDCGVAENIASHERLLLRKIAHGTRNARIGSAMTLDQAHAAMRAGMEIGDTLRGNVLICSGIGGGSHISAALVLARLADAPVHDLLASGPGMDPDMLAHLMVVAQGAKARHHDVAEPVR
jgi:nicotinate-nucleotide--dimethylbenzimidazole phosphoribosyltransferase